MADDTIRIDELRAITERTLDAVERLHGSTVTFDVDYYWHLPVEQAYDLRTTPTITHVGQVSEDLTEIRQSLARDVEPYLAWHDLSHLIGVLRVLEKLTSP